MKWSVCNTTSSDDSYAYFGNTIVPSGFRGFQVFRDGTWKTSYFKNSQLTLASISGNEIGYSKDDFRFGASLDSEAGVIKVEVEYKGVERSLKYFNFGTWTFYNTIYLDNSDKYVTCQVANDNDQFIFAEDEISNSSGRVTPLRPGVFVLKGKVYGPSKVPFPHTVRYGEVGERREYERIYSEGRTSSRGLVMLAENDDRYYGESFEGRPSGFGVRSTRLKGFYSFDYSYFKGSTVLNMPVITPGDNIHVALRAFDDGTYEVLVEDNNQNHIIIECKDNGISLCMYTYHWDTIKIDKNFSTVSIMYSKGDINTYQLFKPKPKPTFNFNIPTPKVEKPTPKVVSTPKVETPTPKPTPKPAPQAKVEANVSPLRKELLSLSTLSSDDHFNKCKEYYDQLVASYKKKHSYYDKMLFVNDFEAILKYFGSIVDDDQFEEFCRTYSKLTARFKSSSEMEEMARKKGFELDHAFGKLENTLNSFDKDAPQIVYNLGKLILTLKQKIAKEAENALKRYKDKYL